MKKILGVMRLPEDVDAFLEEAWNVGYKWLDTAYIYGDSEIQIGESLKRLGDKVGFKVQTKLWTDNFKEAKKYVNESLKKLDMKEVDSILLHRPSWNFDESISAWKTLIELKKSGIVKSIGVSNFDADMIDRLVDETGVNPEANQIELSVSNMRYDRIKYCHDHHIEIQAWSPMGADVQHNISDDVVQTIAADHGATPSQVLLSFVESFDTIVVPGTKRIERLSENVQTIDMTDEEISKLKELNTFDNRYEVTYPRIKK